MLVTGGLILLGVAAIVLGFFMARGGGERTAAPDLSTERAVQESHLPVVSPNNASDTRLSNTIIREETDITAVSAQVSTLAAKLQMLQTQLNEVEEYVTYLEHRPREASKTTSVSTNFSDH